MKLMLRFFVLYTLLAAMPATGEEFLQPTPVQERTLENGLRVVVQELPSQGLVSLSLSLKAGSANEGADTASGISHLIEHLSFRSTHQYPDGKIEEIVKTLGGVINAMTTFDSMTFYLTVPKENLRPALTLLKEMVFFPKLTETEIEKEKKVVRKEMILYNDNPDARLGELLFRTAFQAHPYRHPIIGYPSPFDALTPEQIRHSRALRFVPNAAVLAVVGDIASTDIFTIVQNEFSDLSAPCYAPAPAFDEPTQITPRIDTEHMDMDLARIAFAFPSVSMSDPDSAALDVLGVILGQGESSRLNTKIVNELGLALSVNCAHETFQDKGLFVVTATLAPENIPAVRKIILEEIARFKRSPPSAADIEKAKKIIRADDIFSHDSPGAVADDLSTDKLLTGDAQFSRHSLECLQRVSANDLQRVARQYFRPERLTTVQILPKTVPANTTPSEKLPPAETLSYKMDVLANGIKVIAVRNPMIPALALTVAFEGGLLAENPQNNGISKITAQMLLKGTSRLSESMIHDAFETRGGSIRSFADSDHFGLQATVLKNDFDFTLRTVAEILTQPSFPNAELVKVKDLDLLDIRAQDDQILRRGVLALKKMIYRDHPYGMRVDGSESSLASLTREDLVHFYTKVSGGAPIVIACAGDIDPDDAFNKIKTVFGKFRRSPVWQRTNIPEPAALTAPASSTIIMEREGAAVVFGFLGTTLSDPARAGFDVLSGIMSGSSGRLFRSLRSQDDLSYAQGFFMRANIQQGFFGVYVSTAAEKHEMAAGLLAEQLKLLAANGVSDQEIRDAKNELRTRARMDRQNNGMIASELALDLLGGVEVERFFEYEKYLDAVTKDDVLKIIDRYIANVPFATVRVTSPDQPAH